MKSAATLTLNVFFICLAGVVGCNRSSTNQIAHGKADADAAGAEAEAANTERAKPKAEADQASYIAVAQMASVRDIIVGRAP
jgi:hypothetical protein